MRHLPFMCELPLASRDAWQPAIELSREDARALGIRDGDAVIIESPLARAALRARVHEGMRPGVLGLPLGGGDWPIAGVEGNPFGLLSSIADQKTGQWLAHATRARVRRGV